MTYNGKERVIKAIKHEKVDRVPTSLSAVPEIVEKLMKHFNTRSYEEIQRKLEIDCRMYGYGYIENPSFHYPVYGDGSYMTLGGTIMRDVKNKFGVYQEIVSYVLDDCDDIETAKQRLILPKTSDFNIDEIVKHMKDTNDCFNMIGYSNTFYQVTNWRNLEDFLVDLYTNEEYAKYLIEVSTNMALERTEKLLQLGGEYVDCIQLADDFSTQRAPMISLDMYRKFFKPQMKRMADQAKSYGKYIYMHCCGSVYEFIDDFIEIGVDILDPIQTVATDMEPSKLKTEFGGNITFHGAVETQEILPRGTVEQVNDNVRSLVNTLGKDGGYILSSCHNIQADVPLENVLALYDVKNRMI